MLPNSFAEKTMSNLLVSTISLHNAMVVAGKIFKGDYANSPHYIKDVQQELTNASIPFTENKTFGIYYDNPQEK